MLPRKTAHSTSKAGGAQRVPLFARVLSSFIGATQVAILAGLLYLDTLSTSRGGVHRHVYYMKGIYTAQDGILSPTNALIAALTVLLLTAVTPSVILATKKRRAEKLAPLSVVIFGTSVLSAVVFGWTALSSFGKAHLLYPYLVAGFLGIWALALLNSLLRLIKKR